MGQRRGYLVCQMADSSEIPRLAEPWFPAFDAAVERVPTMAPEDLAKAAPDLKKAAARW